MLNILLILTLTLGSAVIICQAKDGGTIKCDASAREIGETGDVQCMYPTDLNSLTGIAVVSILHFEPNSAYDVPIVDCLWDEIRQCNNVKPGFKVTKITGKSLKVTISKVTKGHFGKYVCKMFHSSLDFSDEPCIFQIKDAVPPPNVIHSSGKEEEGNLYGTGNDDDPPPNGIHISGKEKEGNLYGTGNESEEGLSVAGYVIGAVILPVLNAVIVVLCYLRKRRCIRESPKKDEEEALLRRRTQATIEDPNEVSAEPMLPVNSACGQNSHGTPTETRPSTEKDVMGKGERDPLNGDTGSSGFPHPYSYGRKNRSDDKAKGGGGRGAIEDSKEKEED